MVSPNLFSKSFDKIIEERNNFLNNKEITNDELWYENLRQYAAFSAENGDIEAFNQCVAKDKFWGDSFWQDNDKENLLHYACRGGNKEIIKLVEEKFKSVYNIKTPFEATKNYQSPLIYIGEYLATSLDNLNIAEKDYFKKTFKSYTSPTKFSEVYSVNEKSLQKLGNNLVSADEIKNNYQKQRDIDKACCINLRPELFSENNDPKVKIFKSPILNIGITDNASEPGHVKETYNNGKYSYEITPGTNEPESKVYKIVVPNKNKEGEPDFENTTTLYFNKNGQLIRHQFKGRGSGCLDGQAMGYKGGKSIDQLYKEHIDHYPILKQPQHLAAKDSKVITRAEIGTGTDPLPDQSKEIERLKKENASLKTENQKLRTELESKPRSNEEMAKKLAYFEAQEKLQEIKNEFEELRSETEASKAQEYLEKSINWLKEIEEIKTTKLTEMLEKDSKQLFENIIAPLKKELEDFKKDQEQALEKAKAQNDWRMKISKEDRPIVFATLEQAETLLEDKPEIGEAKIAETMVNLVKSIEKQLGMLPDQAVNKNLISKLEQDPYGIKIGVSQAKQALALPPKLTEEDYKIAESLKNIRALNNPEEIKKAFKAVVKKTKAVAVDKKNDDKKTKALQEALHEEIVNWEQLYYKACLVKSDVLKTTLSNTDEKIAGPIVCDLVAKIELEELIDSKLNEIATERQSTKENLNKNNSMKESLEKASNTTNSKTAELKNKLLQLNKDKKILEDCKQLLMSGNSKWQQDTNKKLDNLNNIDLKTVLRTKLASEVKYEEAKTKLEGLESLHYNHIKNTFNQLKAVYNYKDVNLSYDELSSSYANYQKQYQGLPTQLPELEGLAEAEKQFRKELFVTQCNIKINEQESKKSFEEREKIQKAEKENLELFKSSNSVESLKENIQYLAKNLKIEKDQSYSPVKNDPSKHPSILFKDNKFKDVVITARDEFEFYTLSSEEQEEMRKKGFSDAAEAARNENLKNVKELNDTGISKEEAVISDNPKKQLSDLLSRFILENQSVSRSKDLKKLDSTEVKKTSSISKNEKITFTKEQSALFKKDNVISYWANHWSNEKMPEEERNIAKETVLDYLSSKTESLLGLGVNRNEVEQLLIVNISNILNPSQIEHKDQNAKIKLKGEISALKNEVLERAATKENVQDSNIMDELNDLGYSRVTLITVIKEKAELDSMTLLLENKGLKSDVIDSKKKELDQIITNFALSNAVDDYKNKNRVNYSIGDVFKKAHEIDPLDSNPIKYKDGKAFLPLIVAESTSIITPLSTPSTANRITKDTITKRL